MPPLDVALIQQHGQEVCLHPCAYLVMASSHHYRQHHNSAWRKSYELLKKEFDPNSKSCQTWHPWTCAPACCATTSNRSLSPTTGCQCDSWLSIQFPNVVLSNQRHVGSETSYASHITSHKSWFHDFQGERENWVEERHSFGYSDALRPSRNMSNFAAAYDAEAR